jgi:hypothetical protein
MSGTLLADHTLRDETVSAASWLAESNALRGLDKKEAI